MPLRRLGFFLGMLPIGPVLVSGDVYRGLPNLHRPIHRVGPFDCGARWLEVACQRYSRPCCLLLKAACETK